MERVNISFVVDIDDPARPTGIYREKIKIIFQKILFSFLEKIFSLRECEEALPLYSLTGKGFGCKIN